jgi:outer membrane biosynthesis protein TonB
VHIVRNFQVLLAPLFALGLITLLIVLADSVFDSQIDSHTELTIREVTLAAAPPPPPPQIQRSHVKQIQSPNLQLEAAGQGAQMQLSAKPLDLDILKLKLPEVKLDNQQTSMLSSLDFSWQAFDLSELDELPRLLTKLSTQFPESLKRRGIKKVDVQLSVMIDETGAVLLKLINHNPYPELTQSIKKLVRQARFSIPKKDGIAVRTTFNWPVEFADV